MTKKSLMWKLISVVGFVLCGAPWIGADDKGTASKQQPKHFEKEITVKVKLDYLLYLPPGYEKEEKSWPLVLFLHGAGESGQDLNKVKVHGPPKLIEHGKQFPFIIVSPQCPNGHWWNTELVTLSALLGGSVRVDSRTAYTPVVVASRSRTRSR